MTIEPDVTNPSRDSVVTEAWLNGHYYTRLISDVQLNGHYYTACVQRPKRDKWGRENERGQLRPRRYTPSWGNAEVVRTPHSGQSERTASLWTLPRTIGVRLPDQLSRHPVISCSLVFNHTQRLERRRRCVKCIVVIGLKFLSDETAPIIMIHAVAFIDVNPSGLDDLTSTVGSGAMGPMNLRFVRQARTEGHELKDHCTVGRGAPGPMDL